MECLCQTMSGTYWIIILHQKHHYHHKQQQQQQQQRIQQKYRIKFAPKKDVDNDL